MNGYDDDSTPESLDLVPAEGDVKSVLHSPGQFGATPFTASETARMTVALNTPLSRAETANRPGPGGCRLTYIEGWKVIYDANQIFGFNGWSSKLLSLDVRYVEETAAKRFNACVCATVRITLRDGCIREDRGGGTAEGMRSKGDALLKAEKEAVTDATKRALKNFGLRLGLSLYDRQHVREMNRAPMPNRGPPPQNRAPVASSRGPPIPSRSPVAPIRAAVASKQAYTSPVTPAVPRRPLAAAVGGDAATRLPMTHTPQNGQTRSAENRQTHAAQNGHMHSAQNGQARVPQSNHARTPPNAPMHPAHNGHARPVQKRQVHWQGRDPQAGHMQAGQRQSDHPPGFHGNMNQVQGGNAGAGYAGNGVGVGMKRERDDGDIHEIRRKARAALVQKELDELSEINIATQHVR